MKIGFKKLKISYPLKLKFSLVAIYVATYMDPMKLLFFMKSR